MNLGAPLYEYILIWNSTGPHKLLFKKFDEKLGTFPVCLLFTFVQDETYNSLYWSKAALASISNLRRRSDGIAPSSKGGS